jgi:hypothetical protein
MRSMISIADMRDPQSLASRMRKRRFQFFTELLASVPRPLTICDVGGTSSFWESMGLPPDDAITITVVNLFPQTSTDPRVRPTIGDARALAFPDRSFDVVYSNSVIEHVGTFDDQRRMAGEVRRLGTRYFVQTPNFFFPVEPHFLFPGFQWLPPNLRAWLLTKRNMGWIEREPSFDTASEVVRQIRLMRLGEIRQLFPTSSIYRERVAGLTKSFVAYEGFDR